MEKELSKIPNRIESIGHVLHDIADRCEDEGDRIYFGSTNDPHTLQRQARYLLNLPDELASLKEQNERLVGALERSREGWLNAIELGLIPKRHRNTAQILADEATAALALTAAAIRARAAIQEKQG